MTDNRRFKQGTGCFTCTLCGKRTRQTGKHQWHTQEMCDLCIDMGEHENSINDNTGSWPPEYLAKEEKIQAAMEKAFEERRKANHKGV